MRIDYLLILKFRNIFIKLFRIPYWRYTFAFEHSGISDPDEVSNIISRGLDNKDSSFVVSRFGAVELESILNYIGRVSLHNPIRVALCRQYPWWYLDHVKDQMKNNAGFFSNSDGGLDKYAELVLRSIQEIDILASWMSKREALLIPKYFNPQKIWMAYLDPFWSKVPWTKTLEGKKILVVHPFKDSILRQYQIREKLFMNKDILPKFQSLTVIRSVMSIRGVCGFIDWFDALHYMERQIDETDYDIALIGCGAYGMPLALHCKQTGKKAIHMGGSLQLLFGIKGKRWDASYHKHCCGDTVHYEKLPNEFWISPLESDINPVLETVENGCYL